MKIDINKPLELSDGTPVELSVDWGSHVLVDVRLPHALAGRRAFNRDGTARYSGSDSCRSGLTLRNRINSQEPAMLDLAKPLMTRDGRTATFVGRHLDGTRLFFEVVSSFGPTVLVSTYNDGHVLRTSSAESPGDIINKPELLVSTFVNIYEDGSRGRTDHRTLKDAEARCKVGKVRVGVLEIVQQGGRTIDSAYHKASRPKARVSGYEDGSL